MLHLCSDFHQVLFTVQKGRNSSACTPFTFTFTFGEDSMLSSTACTPMCARGGQTRHDMTKGLVTF